MSTPQNAKLPDLPKPVDWVNRLPGLLPFAIALAVILAAAFILPNYLRRQAADDLKGVPMQTSAGIVRQCLDDPGHLGGGSVFNAVVIDIGGRQVFWDLPNTSFWKPMIGEMVEVHYRVGKSASHVIHIDYVQWGKAMDPEYRNSPANPLRTK